MAAIQDVDAAFAAVTASVAALDSADKDATAKKSLADGLHAQAATADTDENAALEVKVTSLQAVLDAVTKAGEVLAAFKAGT